jgi:DNA invertase Pin-like site-specific DNA recombinase
MTKAIGYVRVSTGEQAASGLGLEAQRQALTEAAARLGFVLGEVFEDAGLSGKLGLEGRPGLFSAIDGLKRGDILLVAKRDRLGRDVVGMAMLERLIERKGARVLSADGSGNGDDAASLLQRRIVDAFSEFERLIIGQRTKAALQAKRQRGERAGTLPFGSQLGPDGQQLIEAPVEQDALRTLRELQHAGLSLRAIAAELTRQGFRTRTGGAWQGQYVHRLLRAV